jgi:phage repressor protein C with HTH and peptisase S24 domain
MDVNMQRVYTLCEYLPMTEMGDRLKQAREKHYKSARQAALRFSWAPSTFAAHENGQNDFSPDDAKKYAKAFKTSASWLLTGEGPEGMFGGGEIESDPDYEARPVDGILEIDVRAGLGGGGSMEGRDVRHDGDYADPVKSESWKFPSRFMREEIRAQESQVIILETDGDSMEPTIGSGERIIVHTGMRTPSPDGIFALRDRFGNIIAKRLQVLRSGDPPRVLIISDNKAHAPEEVGLDEITIVGRVLWGLKRL